MKEESCPICLHSVPLVVTSCNHSICPVCLERILSTCKYGVHEYDDEDHIDDTIINSCLTRGRCPICRVCIDLFDVKDCNGFYLVQRNGVIPDQLSGMSFSNKENTFKISFSPNSYEPPSIIIDNPDGAIHLGMLSATFDEDYNYHVKSNTFLGKVSLKTSLTPGAINEYEVIAQFSQDYRYVSRGIVIVKRDVSGDNIRYMYPLDGSWFVRWQTHSDRGKDRNELESAMIKVTANQFTFYGHTYCISMGTLEQPEVHFDWKLGGVITATQVVESGVDLVNHPAGPNVGEKITWRVDNNLNIFRIFWTRDSISLPPTRMAKVLGSAGMLLKCNQCCTTGSMPSYDGTSIWGNVFIQGLKIGLASYHFNSENDCYISYENTDCSQWPPLDNGCPVPSRVPFVETSFDSSSRTFRGSIPWKEIHNSSWNGSFKWEYEMVFDSEYIAIISGNVKDITENGITTQTHKFNHDLIYINAAIIQRIHASMSTEDREQEREAPRRDDNVGVSQHAILVRSEIMLIKSRLMQEGASPRTLELIFRGSRGALLPELDAIDYNL